MGPRNIAKYHLENKSPVKIVYRSIAIHSWRTYAGIESVFIHCYHLWYFLSSQDWVDDRLKWDPADYNDLTDIVIQPERIWLPELALMNGWVQRCWALDYYKSNGRSIQVNVMGESGGYCIQWTMFAWLLDEVWRSPFLEDMLLWSLYCRIIKGVGLFI